MCHVVSLRSLGLGTPSWGGGLGGLHHSQPRYLFSHQRTPPTPAPAPSLPTLYPTPFNGHMCMLLSPAPLSTPPLASCVCSPAPLSDPPLHPYPHPRVAPDVCLLPLHARAAQLVPRHRLELTAVDVPATGESSTHLA